MILSIAEFPQVMAWAYVNITSVLFFFSIKSLEQKAFFKVSLPELFVIQTVSWTCHDSIAAGPMDNYYAEALKESGTTRLFLTRLSTATWLRGSATGTSYIRG